MGRWGMGEGRGERPEGRAQRAGGKTWGQGPLKSRQGSSLRTLERVGDAGLASQNPTAAGGLKNYS